MQSVKYVRVVKPIQVLEDDKVGSRYFEVIDDFIEVFIKVAGIILFQFKFSWAQLQSSKRRFVNPHPINIERQSPQDSLNHSRLPVSP